MASYSDLIDNSPVGLMDAICARIQAKMKSWWHESEFPEEEFHEPVVHAQYLPVSKTGTEERETSKDYPLVQVVCAEGTIAQGSEIKIQIYFGGYSNTTDNQGWRIPTNMLWAVVQDFLENQIIGGYQITTPMKWSPLNSKDPPYYTMTLETVWKGSIPAVSIPPWLNIAAGEEKFEVRR